MRVAEFIQERRPEWVALEQLLAGAGDDKHARGTAEGLSRLAHLFRNVCADLARARAAGYPDDLVEYLNSLSARAHNFYYRAPPFPLGRLGAFFTTDFPVAVRRNVIYVMAGLLLFFGPMLGMIALSASDSDALFKVVPRGMLEQAERMYEKGPVHGRSEDEDTGMAGFYVYNNVGIAFRCFAGGVFFGLGAIFVLLSNGVMIGATVGFVAQTPSGGNLISFIMGHGPFELFAICLSGAAGLRLGLGPLLVGNRRRSESLRLAAKDAIVLVAGAACLLLCAALIEAFFSPSSLPPAVKIAFGALNALLLLVYLGIWGPHRARQLDRITAQAQAKDTQERR